MQQLDEWHPTTNLAIIPCAVAIPKSTAIWLGISAFLLGTTLYATLDLISLTYCTF